MDSDKYKKFYVYNHGFTKQPFYERNLNDKGIHLKELKRLERVDEPRLYNNVDKIQNKKEIIYNNIKSNNIQVRVNQNNNEEKKKEEANYTCVNNKYVTLKNKVHVNKYVNNSNINKIKIVPIIKCSNYKIKNNPISHLKSNYENKFVKLSNFSNIKNGCSHKDNVINETMDQHKSEQLNNDNIKKLLYDYCIFREDTIKTKTNISYNKMNSFKDNEENINYMDNNNIKSNSSSYCSYSNKINQNNVNHTHLKTEFLNEKNSHTQNEQSIPLLDGLQNNHNSATKFHNNIYDNNNSLVNYKSDKGIDLHNKMMKIETDKNGIITLEKKKHDEKYYNNIFLNPLNDNSNNVVITTCDNKESYRNNTSDMINKIFEKMMNEKKNILKMKNFNDVIKKKITMAKEKILNSNSTINMKKVSFYNSKDEDLFNEKENSYKYGVKRENQEDINVIKNNMKRNNINIDNNDNINIIKNDSVSKNIHINNKKKRDDDFPFNNSAGLLLDFDLCKRKVLEILKNVQSSKKKNKILTNHNHSSDNQNCHSSDNQNCHSSDNQNCDSNACNKKDEEKKRKKKKIKKKNKMKNKSNNKSKNKRETKSKKISNNNNNDNMNNQCDNMGDQRINNENMDKQNVNIQNEGNGFNNNKNNNDLLNVYISPNMINHSLSSTCEKKNKEDNKMNDNKFLNSSSKMKIPEISTNNSNEKIVNVSNDEMLVYHNLTVLNVKEQGGVTEESSCIKRTYFVDQFYDSYNMRNEKITDDNMQVEDIYNVKENIKRTLKGDGHDDVKTNMLSEDNSYASGLWGNEINFISNNENCLNSYDISCDEKYIPNEEEQDEELCSNNILVKDIEEKKMCGKLFFEEICVFRINEKNEHGHENLRKNNHNDDTHKMYSSYENIQNINKQSTNPFCKKDEMEKSQGTNLFYDNYINSVDITKLELNKNCYQHINYEVQNLIKKENSYAAEMNVGLVFRKYIPILINLSCNYLLIKKNEKNVITCISYTNIIDVKIVKKSKKNKERFLFKIVYVFKKKEQKTEKNVTLLFRANLMEIFEKIKGRVDYCIIPNEDDKNIQLQDKKKKKGKKKKELQEEKMKKKKKTQEYVDIETVYEYVIEKYKRVHVLYLGRLLQIVEKLFKKYILKYSFHKLRIFYEYKIEMEKLKKNYIHCIYDISDKLEFLIKKKMQHYFNHIIINSYESSFINYQIKTNDMLYNLLLKEKSAYQNHLGKNYILILYKVLLSMYKKKMAIYFRSFVYNNIKVSKKKNAFAYTLTRVNSILVLYERRIKSFIFSKLKFNYDNVSYFCFTMYKIYLRRILFGYLRIRDNRINIKNVIEKNVYRLVKLISKISDNHKYNAFLKLQKYVYEQNEKKNKMICDNLIYANNELCNNLDKIAIEKGINQIDCLIKFKRKECLMKYFYTLKGPQINTERFYYCIRYCSIFSFVLNKIIQKKVQHIFFQFVLKTLQRNNKNRLTHAIKLLQVLVQKKEKKSVIDVLQLYDKYPYIFQYKDLTKIEVFVICVQNFVTLYNRKLLLNFLLKLHYLKYQEQFMKTYNGIGSIYKFVHVLDKKLMNTIRESFRVILQNDKFLREKMNMKMEQMDMKMEKIDVNMDQMDVKMEQMDVKMEQMDVKMKRMNKKKSKQIHVNYNNKAYSSSSPSPMLRYNKYKDMSSNSASLIKKYPFLIYNSEISPDCTTMADDKLSLPSNESVTHIFSYAYEDMDKIKKKIYDFNNKMSNVDL
ncbi:hypothetical protein PFHG_00791 [Plasmodium falciparum HB3]|uniref:Uncharacterized protein n=1 Tax=Plasmodium falciparum (isolate HB3) TaxID=137071 RepID=A0A0L7K825_PLAFX|nr:hypothetical protein PFHG_00791 [Plasmodium falciparum HB3]